MNLLKEYQRQNLPHLDTLIRIINIRRKITIMAGSKLILHQIILIKTQANQILLKQIINQIKLIQTFRKIVAVNLKVNQEVLAIQLWFFALQLKELE